MKRTYLALVVLLLAALTCNSADQTVPPAPQNSVFDSGRTAYGFFPSPQKVSLISVLQTYKGIAEHGDFVLLQQNTTWEDFVNGVDGESQGRTDIINQVKLARQNGLETVFVLDALNGLDRRAFIGLPADWEAGFGNPDVRAAYKNFALWIVRSFQPRYLGLASEINTYMTAHSEDAQNFISLYNEIYNLIKAEAPETQVFVTFQWDSLNNLLPQFEGDSRQKPDINWEQVEAFEPNLDLWAISTYPYFIFNNGTEIPSDYYSPLLTRTDKPVTVAEGGFATRDFGPIKVSPEDQVAYLNAIHTQLGPRLVFWVNTILSDFDLNSYARELKKEGHDPQDAETLGFFAHIGLREFDGSPKPALETWDGFRKSP